ncbi:hypothetical protein JCM3766R1_003775 [Sporobolomyces carnicolor]
MSRSVDFLGRVTTSSTRAPGGLSSAPPPSCSILITDTLASPSLFLVAQLISRTLRRTTSAADAKGKGKAKVVLVGVREVESEYTAVLKKQSVQLGAEKTLGRFEFVDGSRGDLNEIYAGVASAVGTGDDDEGRLWDEEGTLVIVDDLTALSWLGNDLAKVVKFDRALKHLCLSTRSTLASVVHSDSVSPHPVVHDESDQYLFRKVLQSSDYWFELKSLVSQARGELSIHPGPALLASTSRDERLRTRVGKESLEYTLEENGAVFEVKGLGRFI